MRLAVVFPLSLALAECALRTAPAPLTPLPQGRIGAVDSFGPGIVVASSSTLRFVLARPASVIVLQLFPDGIDVIRPSHSHDRTEFSAGDHQIDGPVFPPPWAGVPSYSESIPSESRCQAAYAMAVVAEPVRDSLGRPIPGQVSPYAGWVLWQCEARRGPALRTAHTSIPVPPLGPDSAYWMLIVADVPTSARDLQLRLLPMNIVGGNLASVLQDLPGVLMGGRTELWAAYYVPVRR